VFIKHYLISKMTQFCDITLDSNISLSYIIYQGLFLNRVIINKAITT